MCALRGDSQRVRQRARVAGLPHGNGAAVEGAKRLLPIGDHVRARVGKPPRTGEGDSVINDYNAGLYKLDGSSPELCLVGWLPGYRLTRECDGIRMAHDFQRSTEAFAEYLSAKAFGQKPTLTLLFNLPERCLGGVGV
jgi:hypothetical protein